MRSRKTEIQFPFIYITSADQSVMKPVSQWSAHHANQTIVLAHDASAGGPLRFVAEAAVS